MAMFSTLGGIMGGGGVYPQYSLSAAGGFRYLTRTISDYGSINLKTFGVSLWLRMTIGSTSELYINSGAFSVRKTNTDLIEFVATNGLSNFGQIRTNAGAIASSSAWYHVYASIDTTQAVAADRLKLFLNGVAASDGSPTLPAINSEIGTPTGNVSVGLSQEGLLYAPAFFSGTLPSIGQLYSAGEPLDIRGLAGLVSMIDLRGGVVTTDYKLSGAWTNGSGLTGSASIP